MEWVNEIHEVDLKRLTLSLKSLKHACNWITTLQRLFIYADPLHCQSLETRAVRDFSTSSDGHRLTAIRSFDL